MEDKMNNGKGKLAELDEEFEVLEIDNQPQRSQLEQEDIGLVRLLEWPIGRTGRTVVCHEGDGMEVDDTTRNMPQGASGPSTYEKKSVSKDGLKRRPARPARTLSAFTGLMDRSITQEEMRQCSKNLDGRRNHTKARSLSPRRQGRMVSKLQYEERRSFRKEMYDLQVKWKEEKERKKNERRLQNLRRDARQKVINKKKETSCIPSCTFV